MTDKTADRIVNLCIGTAITAAIIDSHVGYNGSWTPLTLGLAAFAAAAAIVVRIVIDNER